MKRYLLFGGDCYYPLGGMEDFMYDFDFEREALNTYERQKKIFEKSFFSTSGKWLQLWDSMERKSIKEETVYPKKL